MGTASPEVSRLHYAWIIAAVTFVVLLVTAGIRATPSVLMVPLEGEFGWSRAAISGAVAINIALFGLIGPFAAALMDRWGLRRVVALALALLAMSVAASTQMRAQWQLTLLWGVLVGAGTGVTSLVLAAIVANRWFDERRGVVIGALSAANATGQLLFLPFLASLIARSGWRAGALAVAVAAAAVCVVAFLLMRDRPEDKGLKPYGWHPSQSLPASPPRPPLQALVWAARRPAFWVLAGSFFVCGASTNGLIGTHLIPACHDYGIPEVRAAGLLAVMGIFDILGTTASGWSPIAFRAATCCSPTMRCAGCRCSSFPRRSPPGARRWRGSPSSTASTGSRPCLLRYGSRRTHSVVKTRASSMAGLARPISSGPRLPHSAPAPSARISARTRRPFGSPAPSASQRRSSSSLSAAQR
jgi:MFS family permease